MTSRRVTLLTLSVVLLGVLWWSACSIDPNPPNPHDHPTGEPLQVASDAGDASTEDAQ